MKLTIITKTNNKNREIQMKLNQTLGLMCAFCVLATFSQIPRNYRQVYKVFFSRFISLPFLMIKENLEDGGDCGRSSRHWDGISLHSLVCYLCLAHQQHLLVRDTALSDGKLQFLAVSQFPWGRMEDIYLWQAIKNMHKACLGQPNTFY